jgi:hypothetical protein
MQLDASDQETLRHEVRAFLDRLSSPHAKPTYERVLNAIEQADVPDDLLEPLGRVLELSLGTGRLRKIHGPHAEMSIRRLFDQTPQGKALRATLDAANQALRGLSGQTISRLTFALTSPGAYSLVIDTDQCQAQLVIDSAGVQVRSLDLGV